MQDDYMKTPFDEMDLDYFQKPEIPGLHAGSMSEAQKSKDHYKKDGHTHGHLGATTCQDGHVHMHPGVTSTPIENEQGHFHHMKGNTSFDDGHIHQYETYTSLPIQLPGGYHTHYVEISTTEDDGHIHVIKGFTQPSKS
ncbi:YmaF family protein [Filibacter tadaridae]|uniref:YmaF family protein n=1 Tax=Filibacter tadaridae TaxID=2483811 RepID=A0A3P5X2E4_9BACL|nr:YmaF family protein [Filibacter tadaridae]VDC28104.1 YmaF family protein [Filibacter tadaridae]